MKKTIGFLLILTLPFLLFSFIGLLSGQWIEAFACATFVDLIIIIAVFAILIAENFFDN